MISRKNRVKILALQGGFDDDTSKGVSEILSYFGGQNRLHFDYKERSEIYFYIDDVDFSIHRFNILDPSCAELFNRYDFVKYSVSYFKELYPYVFGDCVELWSGEKKVIQGLKWDFANGQVVYVFSAPSGKIDILPLSAIKCKVSTTSLDLGCVSEEKISITSIPAVLCKNSDGNLEIHYDKSLYETKETAEGIVLVKKGVLHLLPETFKDCCNHKGLDPAEFKVSGYSCESLSAFQRLLFCRDVWYGILENKGISEGCYSLYGNSSDEIEFDDVSGDLFLFNFPTREIRDKFYNCFKKDLRKCALLIK